MKRKGSNYPEGQPGQDPQLLNTAKNATEFSYCGVSSKKLNLNN